MTEEMTTAAWLREFADKAEDNPRGWWLGYYHSWSGETFTDYVRLFTTAIEHPEYIARKPRMVEVSGPGGTYYYPEPLQEPPPGGTRYWAPDKRVSEWASFYEWADSPGDHLRLRRGLCHLERESAVKHAKAEILAAGLGL